MKSWKLLFGLLLIVCSCEDSFTSQKTSQPLNDLNTSTSEIWRQVSIRYPATGEIVPVQGAGAIEIQVTGEELLFISEERNCPGRISDDGISLGECYYQSPYWIIAERTDDTMHIYPRMGAMYYYDYVLKKLKDGCESKCDLIPLAGFCKAAIPRYFYNKSSGSCEEFYWGGCYGVVPFETMEECESCKCNQME